VTSHKAKYETFRPMFRVVIVPIATTFVANKPYMYMYMYARWAENTPQKQRRIIIVN